MHLDVLRNTYKPIHGSEHYFFKQNKKKSIYPNIRVLNIRVVKYPCGHFKVYWYNGSFIYPLIVFETSIQT